MTDGQFDRWTENVQMLEGIDKGTGHAGRRAIGQNNSLNVLFYPLDPASNI
jgi:hypothetical protein